MAKKQVAVSLRKPPPTNGHGVVPPGVATIASASIQESFVSTRAGDRRELTVYLPIDLAKKLSVRCLELECDVSTFVADAIAKALAPTAEPAAAPPPQVVPVTAPVSFWARVRALLAELAGYLPFALPPSLRFS